MIAHIKKPDLHVPWIFSMKLNPDLLEKIRASDVHFRHVIWLEEGRFLGGRGGRSTAIIHVHEENIQQEVTSQLCTRTPPTFKTHPRARKKPTWKWTRQCWKLRSNDKLRAACASFLLWLHSDFIWALQRSFPHFGVSYWRILGWNRTLACCAILRPREEETPLYLQNRQQTNNPSSKSFLKLLDWSPGITWFAVQLCLHSARTNTEKYHKTIIC